MPDATWGGTPDGTVYNLAANWTPATVPVGAGSDAVFGSTGSKDVFLTGIIQAERWTFTADAQAYEIRAPFLGDRVDFLGGGIVYQAANSTRFDLAVGGTGSLQKSGAGRVTFAYDTAFSQGVYVSQGEVRTTSTLTAPINLTGGTVFVSQAGVLTGNVFQFGGSLEGFGKIVGDVYSAGGQIAPGFNANPETLRIDGDLRLATDATFAIVITSFGSDKLIVRDSVDLGQAQLQVDTPSTPFEGTRYTIVQNDSSSAVTGTFDGFAEGSRFNAGAGNYRITYRGGDGNDVEIGYSVADLAVSVTGAPTSVRAGDLVTYQITLANGGDSSASNVSLTSLLPAGTTFISLSGPAGYVVSAPAVGSGGTITATRSSLAVGDSATFTVTVAVDPGYSGVSLTIAASASSTSSDFSGLDNTASATVGVTRALPSYAITVDRASMVEGTAPAAGQSANFTMTRTGDLTQAATIAYTLAGSASSGTDYTGGGLGTLTFTAGAASASLVLTTTPDSVVESDETVTVVLGRPSDSGAVTTTSATVIITNDDAGPAPPPLALTYVGTQGPDNVVGTALDDRISALDGSDRVEGDAGDDIIYVGSGDNVVFGGAGQDIIVSEGGADLLLGNEGADTISAGDGDNTVVGGQDSTDAGDLITTGSGRDLIWGNGGADTIVSGAEADTVIGGYGSDVLVTGEGDDIIFANQDSDLVLANQGNDLVFAGFGDDTVLGGQGDDVIWGNEGNDVLFGNEGGDRYVFLPGSGADQINGFSTGDGDRLNLQGQTFTLGTSSDGDITLQFSGGGTVELNGVAPAQFSGGFVV